MNAHRNQPIYEEVKTIYLLISHQSKNYFKLVYYGCLII